MLVNVKHMDNTCPSAMLSAIRFIALPARLLQIQDKEKARPKRFISRAQILNRYIFSWLFLSSLTIMSAEVTGQTCISPDCGKPAKLQCPTCLKQGISGSFFCSQDCFKTNWVCLKSILPSSSYWLILTPNHDLCRLPTRRYISLK